MYKAFSKGIQRRVEASTSYQRPRSGSIQRHFVVLACLGTDQVAFVNKFTDHNDAQRLLGQLNKGYKKLGLRVFVTERPQSTTTTWGEMRAQLRGEQVPMRRGSIADFQSPPAPAQQQGIPPWEDDPPTDTS